MGGLFFFLAGCSIFFGILLAEIFYPGQYSISQNMISSLAATPPPDSVSHEPSKDIFDYSLIIGGTLIILAGFLTRKKLKPFLLIPIMFMGLGVFGVGLFPAYHVLDHPISALTAFLFGGVAAVLSWRVIKSPFRYIAIILGSTSLIFLFLAVLFPESVVPIFGRGGVERLVAYPLVVWILGFGAYLMGSSNQKN